MGVISKICGWGRTVKRAAERHSLRFNYISLHYTYISSLILLTAVILFAADNMAFIDSLFFASGAATQSGLNTIDINTIKIYQQVMIYIIPMITTPIFINLMVVLTRLYWFEQRFEHVVRMSQQESRAISMAKSRERNGDMSTAEQGLVGNRNIKVIHTGGTGTPRIEGPDGVINMHMSMSDTHSFPSLSRTPSSGPASDTELKGAKYSDASLTDSSGEYGRPAQLQVDTSSVVSFQRQAENTGNQIQFAEPPRTRDGQSLEQVPERDRIDTHIAFVEHQRARPEGKALRIPGPREFERGQRAVEVDDDDTYTLHPSRTTDDPRISRRPSRSFSMAGAGTNSSLNIRRRRVPTLDATIGGVSNVLSNAFSVGAQSKVPRLFSRSRTQDQPDMPYLSYKPTIARNSKFLDLTDEQRDELGGIEYRSLKLLAKIIITYYVFFHVLGIIGLLPWILRDQKYMDVVKTDGVNACWWAIFSAESAFNDVGFTLTPDSMVRFATAVWPLILMTFLIIIGNTGFPCMLRFIIWVSHKIAPSHSRIKEPLNFLLDHPRRCFTLLFPARETWVLFYVLVFLNVADVLLYILLDLNDPSVTDTPVGFRILDAIFQAAATRTAGMSVVSIGELHPAVQVSYLIMMYISVFPIAISVRRTNVYEEQSLGLYTEPDEETDPNSTRSYVGVHLRKQLSFDLWYIFLGLFAICIAEGKKIDTNNQPQDYAFNAFAILFEVVSAYGTVGLSLGFPGTNPSFSAKFSTFSKLVIVAMQIRGRHRAMPYELDRAILLPNEKKEEEVMSMHRRRSSVGQRPFGWNDQDLPMSMSRSQGVSFGARSARSMGARSWVEDEEKSRRTTIGANSVFTSGGETYVGSESRPMSPKAGGEGDKTFGLPIIQRRAVTEPRGEPKLPKIGSMRGASLRSPMTPKVGSIGNGLGGGGGTKEE